MVIPGNALACDGSGDYVIVPFNAAFSFGTGDFTLEAWIRTTSSNGTVIGRSVLNFSTGLYTDGYSLGISSNGQLSFTVAGITVPANFPSHTILAGAFYNPYPINDGRWHHIAGVRKAGRARMYVDGESSEEISLASATNITGDLGIGANHTLYPSPVGEIYETNFTGSIDEVRIYNTGLIDTQVQTDMVRTSSASPANLLLYYNFDQGTAGGVNTGITTAVDQSGNNRQGTLHGFTLNGGNSNFVASYAMIVPVATSATGLSGVQGSIGFTANWTPPVNGGTVDNYIVDIRYKRQLSANSFSTGVLSGSPFSVSGGNLSKSVSGTTLFASMSSSIPTTYYYRVRATSSSGQSASSSEIAVTMPVLTVPSISAGTVTGTIASCAGTASASPNLQQFNVSGNNLATINTNTILATAPSGFEISTLAGNGYGNTVTLTPTGGVLPATTIFVRSAASASSVRGRARLVLVPARLRPVSAAARRVRPDAWRVSRPL